MAKSLSYAHSLPDSTGGRIAFWHGGDTPAWLARVIDKALAEAWREGYDAGDLDASVARCQAMGYTTPEGQEFPTRNPYIPAADPELTAAQDRWAERFTNPDLWR